MGTRSDIIVHRADGKWARVYCHWDGYIEHNGKLLFEHYSDQMKADALVSLGDISSLGGDIGEKHDFDYRGATYGGKRSYDLKPGDPGMDEFTRLSRMCCVYGRDRGETGVDAGFAVA